MKKQLGWLFLSLALLPVVVGLVVLTLDRGSSDLSIPGFTGKRIGLLRLDGVILDAREQIDLLRSFYQDKNIAAVLVRVNSPGGAVSPAQEIYSQLLRFRKANKPVVVSMDNVAASGGYYIASAATTIFANPGTLTGSIGVAMEITHYYKLLEKIGVKLETMKSGKHKDIGTPLREMTKEERDLLQSVLDDSHRQFVEDICSARSMDCDSVRRIADGRIFTGRQAHALGLVDSIGGFEDALDYCREIAGLPSDAKLYERKHEVPFWRQLLPDEVLTALGLLQKASYPAGIYYLYGGF